MATENYTNAVLVIHGGAGIITREQLGEREQDFHDVLTAALSRGYDAWKAGLSAVDIVTIAVSHLEDSPLFNAGCGEKVRFSLRNVTVTPFEVKKEIELRMSSMLRPHLERSLQKISSSSLA